MNWLCSFSQKLENIEGVIDDTILFPNSSLYRVGDKIRFVEYRYIEGKREHHIVSIDNSEYIEEIINLAISGADIFMLTEVLAKKDISHEEAREFIFQLIENQLLVTDLEPPVTGEGYLKQIIQRLSNLNISNGGLISDLQYVYQNIKNTKTKSPEIDLYFSIKKRLENIDPGIDDKYLFQCDMARPAHTCSLNKKCADELLIVQAVL